jgi:hypothetical protein
MEATWVGRLALVIGLLGMTRPALSDEPDALAGEAPASSARSETSKPVEPAKKAAEPEKRPSASEPVADKPPAPGDPAAASVEATERLKKLGPLDKDATSSSKALRETFEERLRWLDDWDKAVKARKDAEHPETSPERQAADWKADLERVKTQLDQAAKKPERLLPSSFRNLSGQLSDSVRADMKEAIDSAKGDLKDWEGKLEKLRATQTGKPGNSLGPLRIERDKIYQRVVTLKARGDKREAAVASAKTSEARELTREQLVTFTWESRVEWERLQAQEARLALESKLSDLVDLNRQLLETHVLLARQSLDQMQACYQAASSRQERDLKQAAANEEKKAERSDDPLERFRARRMAALLDLKAHVLTNESALTTSPSPSLEEQRALADRTEADLAAVKHLLDDGRLSHLDALRLNNDFRRIGPERDRVIHKDMVAAARILTYYENALSKVEIDLVNDTRDDRLEHDDLLDRLPKWRHAEAIALFEDLDRQEVALLNRRRVALEKLAARAEQTYDQIVRRVGALDDHYGFIRTHIFWVRDEEPIWTATFAQGKREVILLGRSLFRVAIDSYDRALWGQVSPEFVIGLVLILALPWPLRRARRALSARSSETSRPAPAVPPTFS